MKKFDYRRNRVVRRLSKRSRRFNVHSVSYENTKTREFDPYDLEFYWYKRGKYGSVDHEDIYLHCEDIEINYKCQKLTGVRSE